MIVSCIFVLLLPSTSHATLEAFSAKKPLIIKFKLKDEQAVCLKNITCALFDLEDRLITKIATSASMSKGKHFFVWNARKKDGKPIANGRYYVSIKAFDQAGNKKISMKAISIDTSAPKILSAEFSPKTMTSASKTQKVIVKTDEPATVFIRMKNKETGTVNVYLAKSTSHKSTGAEAQYTWDYSNQFSAGLKDGVYEVEISAQDKAGNESAAFEAGNIRVDRTPPVIYAQAAVPYVLSNIGANPYTTTLSYMVSEPNSAVTIKVIEEKTGKIVKTLTDKALLNSENKSTWNGSSIKVATGSYRFKIIAEDKFGNYSVAYATCVKDGIAPVISFPAANANLSGVVAIKGTAIDPDWTNDKLFERYSLYYAIGKKTPSTVPEKWPTIWKKDFIKIPEINGNGTRPLQGNSTLGYLYTTGLKNGEYTILVVVEEKEGIKIACARHISVYNDAEQTATQPFIKLHPIAPSVSFNSDNSVKLPINFVNSVAPANVYVEIVEAGLKRLVFHKKFQNVAGTTFTGKPTYENGKDLGYFIWMDANNVWHIEWSHDGKLHRFSGNIVALDGKITPLPQGEGMGVRATENLISWNTTSSGGFSFKPDHNVQQLMIFPKIDEETKSPQIYASNIYMGIAKNTKSYLPIMIDVKNSNGGNLSSSGCEWDGKLETGAYADSGNYIVRVRAEGINGFGLATAESRVNIITPFEVKNIETVNQTFSPFGLPDRVSIFYGVSKDSNVSAYVYDYRKNLVSTLFENKKVLGGHCFSWKGNYPDSTSGTIVTGGNYLIKLVISALDGSGSFTKEISGISVQKTISNENYAKINPIGKEAAFQGSKVRLAQGESPYYYEAKASGYYHPPRDFTYNLSASGKQRFTMYPYVPFAGLMHRGFKQVDIKAKITYRVHYQQYLGYRVFHGEVWGNDKYDITNVLKANLTENNPALHDESICGPRGDRGSVTRIETSIEVYAAGDDKFLLDYSDWIDVSDSIGKLTKKGIFRINFKYALESTKKINYDVAFDTVYRDLKTYKASAVLELEDNIKYSRLTNRFIPWYGFVNKNHPLTKDFSVYLTDINRGLGFPGKLFFDDPNAKPDTPHKKTPEDIGGRLGGKSWEEKAAELKILANQANLLGYKGSLASSAGYDNYLSDEYFEYIPISSPAGQEFIKVNNTTYTVKTDAVLLSSAKSGESQNTFSFSWPNPAKEINSWKLKYGMGGDNYKTLIGSGKIDKPEKAQKWDAYGKEENICFYELNESGLKQTSSSANLSGKTIYYKSSGRSFWESDKSLRQLLPVPDHVENLKYSISTDAKELKLELRDGAVYAEDLSSPQAWSTDNDSTLLASGGKIISGSKIFNEKDFCGKKHLKFFPEYKIDGDFNSKSALQYTFLTEDPFKRNFGTNIDNPNLEINDWKVSVFDKSKNRNPDLKVHAVKVNADHRDDYFILKLNSNSSEKRFVEITGSVSGPYEIIFFDGSTWKTIAKESSGRTGNLAWWDVNRLNGKYTVLLKTGSYISTQNISIGTLVKRGETKKVFSAYRRALLSFPEEAFKEDQLVTITPVSMTEIKLRNRPILMTHGPIVEIKPSPYKFDLDKRPTLSFFYTFDDLKNHGYWNGAGQPSGLGLNIHQITAKGDLQIVDNNNQTVEKDSNGDLLYVFHAPLSHFSTYTLVNGKFRLSAPVIFADRYITNKNTVNIWGTAEPESELQLFVSKEPRSSFSGFLPQSRGLAAKDGKFKFSNIKLLQEGKNYIYVASNPKGEINVKTQNYVEIIKDTFPPRAAASSNLSAFSPNKDGKWDEATFTLSSNENGKLKFIVTDPDSALLLSQTLSVESDRQVNLAWGKNGFNIYQQQKSGKWLLLNSVYFSNILSDGYYPYTVFSIDQAGNISNNIRGSVVIDTTPPNVLSLDAKPNPFTPNNDGVKDNTTFSFKLSEPAYSTINIFRNDNILYRRYSKTVGDKQMGSWTWDGRGARNELIGGNYSYFIQAEDAVGNVATSETKTIKVDHIPSLLDYAYADPDPFSPAKGNFTNIKYYLARDNCRVKVFIVGPENKPIKNLVLGELQNKGEHIAKWYGDFLPGYSGRVADGMYEFRVIAQDQSGGKPASVSNTVLVDNTPPAIFLYPVKIDPVTKKATLKYNIPEQASLEVSVYNDEGKYIQNLYSGNKNAGTYSLDYLKAMDTDLRKKYFKLLAIDKAKNSFEKNSELFTLNTTGSINISEHLANPSAFTPNGDSHTDLTRISYRLSGGTTDYIVTVKIIDSANSTINTIVDAERQSAGIHSYYWGGKTDLKDGLYQYEITVEDRTGDKAIAKGEILTVVTKPTTTILAPNSSDTALLTYSINYPAQWITNEADVKIDIKTGTGEVIFTKNFRHSAGTYNHTWAPATLPSGTYYIYLNATDGMGTHARPQKATVIVNYDDKKDYLEEDKTTPEADTIAPIFSSLSSDPLLAQDQTEITISFITSEDLISNPKVTINGEETKKPPFLFGKEYKYTYTVKTNDRNGVATIGITGEDSAGNKGSYSTNKIIESFRIDTSNPVVVSYEVKAKEYLISQPSPFTPNNDKINDVTYLYYSLSESADVTARVYRGSDLVKTLVTNLWQEKGGEILPWRGDITSNQALYDKDNNGYADSGKYDFIVEARDKAGNITDRKYGGTVWIQESILKIVEPDQWFGVRIFSPSGASNTVLYFRVNRESYPKDYKKPEWISVKAVNQDVGTYTVRIYDSEGSLIRTLVNSQNIKSSVITGVKWDGRDSSLAFVADGRYRIVVEVKDFTGVAAHYGNPFEKWVIVDKTPPNLANLSVSNQYISPNSSQSTATKTTSINYSLSDNFSSLTSEANGVSLFIDVYHDLSNVMRLDDVTKEVTATSSSQAKFWDGTIPGGSTPVGSAWGSIYPDGTYTYRITATDLAGNIVTKEANDLVVDTIAPNGSILIDANNQYATSTSVALAIFGSDTTSTVTEMKIWGLESSEPSTWETYSETKAWTLTNSQGNRTINLRLKDRAGNTSIILPDSIYLDSVSPTGEINIAGGAAYTTNISVSLSLLGSDGESGITKMKIWNDGDNEPSTELDYTASKTWSLRNVSGARIVYVKYKDNAGNWSSTYSDTIILDSAVPTGSMSVNTNAAYINSTSVTLNISASDNGSGVSRMKIWNDGGNEPSSDQAYSASVSWALRNSEGKRTVYIKFKDNAGNWSSTYSDNIFLDSLPPIVSPPSNQSFNPYLNALSLNFSVSDANLKSVSAKIKFGTITIKDLSVSGNFVASWDGTNNSGDYVNEGIYLLEIQASDKAGNSSSNNICSISLNDNQYISAGSKPRIYIDGGLYIIWINGQSGDGKNFKLYKRHCQQDYAKNIVDSSKYTQSGPDWVLYHDSEPSTVKINGITHKVWQSGKNIYYQRNNSSSINIAKGIDYGYKDPVVSANSSGEAFLSWCGSFGLASSIYFQKIPVNFAPLKGTVSAAGVKTGKNQFSAKPELISPGDGETIKTLRPTFKWIGIRGVTDYSVIIGKINLLSTPDRTFNKTATQSEALIFEQSIHDFDQGLDRGEWQWQVLANPSQTNESKSEIWSFDVDPPLTIAGITNYPNPFNPNNERTKIRYRLGAEADDVTIRIYDITGSLVRELDGTTNAETGSTWNKYNDVNWDGKNDMGDIVLNGIYPFEIIAKLGGASVNGRGKIAVLK
ncbi:MAG: hypothetical protein HQ564_02815 [Candidatus Saganbacteria bacterium]|nr:hypothetical protein [Candidatus Saganbacteria bacterium]